MKLTPETSTASTRDDLYDTRTRVQTGNVAPVQALSRLRRSWRLRSQYTEAKGLRTSTQAISD